MANGDTDEIVTWTLKTHKNNPLLHDSMEDMRNYFQERGWTLFRENPPLEIEDDQIEVEFRFRRQLER
jgi:hypothetical protein